MTIKGSTTYANGTSYLHIKDARRADVGNFRCIADNRVANPTSRDVLLIVKCKYFAYGKIFARVGGLGVFYLILGKNGLILESSTHDRGLLSVTKPTNNLDNLPLASSP